MTTTKNTQKMLPSANLSVQVGNLVRGYEELNTSKSIETARYYGTVLRINNGIATIIVAESETGVFDGTLVQEFTHALTVVAR